MRRSRRSLQQSAAAFHRELDAARIQRENAERENAANIKARKKALSLQAKALLVSDEAKPWIRALSERTGQTLKETIDFLASEATWKPGLVLRWADESRAKATEGK